MATHQHGHTIERHCDVLIVGGTEAALGLAADLRVKGRAVIVVDSRGHDDSEAAATSAARDEARRHGAEVLAGRITAVDRLDGHGRVTLTGGHAVVARLVVEAEDAAALDAAAVDAQLAAAPAASAHAADWDRRYGGDQIWSGNPNGTLVHEVTGLTPGRALDVGAGEGADALWLAEQGWEVTANDISRVALERAGAEATRRGTQITCMCGDANEVGALPVAAFDLVSAQYASLPRRADDQGVANLFAAVAPGGRLLVVSHDLAPMRAPVDTATQSRAFDPDAYVRVEDVAAAVAAAAGWEVEVYETRPRPPGSATASHHVDDLVFRARRLP